MAKRLSIPAFSRELEFWARHSDEADEVQGGNIEAEQSLIPLLDAVGERADQDVSELFKDIQKAVDAGLRGLLRVQWGRISFGSWQLRGLIHMARGPRKRIGSVGLYIRCSDVPGIVGWVFPRGGLDGRRELAHACKGISGVHLASDRRKLYPDWGNDDAVIWLDEKAANLSRSELCNQIQRRARSFFRVAKPALKRLASGA